MKIDYNGKAREMTEAEFSEDNSWIEKINKPLNSYSNRLFKLEQQLFALTEGYSEGVSIQ